MGQYDPQIDEYIAKSPAYAQPIITHLRHLIHQAVPDVVEAIKWSHPHFDYKGPFIGIGAFKKHMGLNFWKNTIMDDPHGLIKVDGSAGSIGKITSMADLPADDILLSYICHAAGLNDKNMKVVMKKEVVPKKELPVPDDLIAAFKKNTDAMQHFQQFSSSAKREYIEWLEEAKTAATRQKRLGTMMEWMTEGKTRNWKYK